VIPPDWLDIYLPSGGFPLEPQDHELDWGDQREVRLVYAPSTPFGWRMSASYRWGESNGSDAGEDGQLMATCGRLSPVFPNPVCWTATNGGPVSWGVSFVNDREDYAIADLTIGRDVGFGGWGGGTSVVSAGLRGAELTSESHIENRGDPDHIYEEGFVVTTYVRRWHSYRDYVDAERTFKGAGPVLSWEGAGRLAGSRSAGYVDLDWNVTGGVLFGKQAVELREESKETYLVATNSSSTRTTATTVRTRPESNSVQVPVFGATLGLSYSIDRMKVGIGYRWERYYDAVNGGDFEKDSKFDRTIDGPYFKLAIGFGG
jgi:hypothetical protein